MASLYLTINQTQSSPPCRTEEMTKIKGQLQNTVAFGCGNKLMMFFSRLALDVLMTEDLWRDVL